MVVEWAERLTLPPDRLDLHFAFPPEPPDPNTAPPDPATAPPCPGAAPPCPGPSAATPDTAATIDHRIVTITPQGPNWPSRLPNPLAIIGPPSAAAES